MRLPHAALRRALVRPLALTLPVALLAALPATQASPPSAPAAAAAAGTERAQARLPRLRVRTVVGDLDIPWDVQVLPGGTKLLTERGGRLSTHDGTRSTVDFPENRVWAAGETGLMSLAVDPGFRNNRRFYTCTGWVKSGGGHDVRVNAWRLSADEDDATFQETLVKGFPTSSGRHGGCRLLIARNGALVVGTGDAAQGRNPRNLKSLGGKTLRLNRFTGRPWRGNPFRNADNRRKRYVFTYGHRNVQGLAQRRNGTLWSVEHGSYRDDEVNLLRGGGDYGWHPVPGYNESVPMTDRSLPGPQRGAKWRSGNPTLATSGAAWVRGKRWGRLNGTLAVAALGSQRMIFMKFSPKGKHRWSRAPQALRGERLRSVTLTPQNALLVTTSDGGGNDRVLRITPRRRG
ncbi:PQQ-dependent sugar dehydrogenase [Nocardioides sp. GXQ0305]|uniref:PQQ-dependent sugar dehydrogenase n=1 Tax=Nocardioides sp. GXQ0305 TaxID=3423912 RepID=UPI003D7C895A